MLLIENSVGTTFFSSLIVSLGGLQCSRVLHNALLHSNLRWAMEMFDITPLGRIVNRFSKDIDTIDNVLPFNIRVVLSQAFMVKRKQMSKKFDNPYPINSICSSRTNIKFWTLSSIHITLLYIITANGAFCLRIGSGIIVLDWLN